MTRLITVLLLVLAAAAFAADDGVFRNTDIFELEVAIDPQISPDGSQIAYVRSSMDIMSDRAVSNIWIVDVDGDNHRPLLSGAHNYGNQRWSPNGDRLAFVSGDQVRGAQINVRWMDTGQTAMLTNVRQAPSSISWSPDGAQIAFEMFVEKEAASLVEPPDAPEGADWAPPVKVIDTMKYRGDGDGYLDTGNTHLFVLSAEGGTPRQLTSGEYDHSGPLAWTSDGGKIVFAANRQDDWEHDPLKSKL